MWQQIPIYMVKLLLKLTWGNVGLRSNFLHFICINCCVFVFYMTRPANSGVSWDPRCK